jgi:hypothetical protein
VVVTSEKVHDDVREKSKNCMKCWNKKIKLNLTSNDKQSGKKKRKRNSERLKFIDQMCSFIQLK